MSIPIKEFNIDGDSTAYSFIPVQATETELGGIKSSPLNSPDLKDYELEVRVASTGKGYVPHDDRKLDKDFTTNDAGKILVVGEDGTVAPKFVSNNIEVEYIDSTKTLFLSTAKQKEYDPLDNGQLNVLAEQIQAAIENKLFEKRMSFITVPYTVVPNTFIGNKNDPNADWPLGSEISWSGWSSTDFVETNLFDGQVMYIRCGSALTWGAFYDDDDKNPIRGISCAASSSGAKVIIPDGAAYFRISYGSGYFKDLVLLSLTQDR